MQSEIDGIKHAVECSKGWHSWFPFAALMVRDSVPPNRPMTTRLLEQIFVAVIAGGGSAYGVSDVAFARQAEQIRFLSELNAMQNRALQEQLRQTEDRLTAQIVELRARQLK
jgi:hypothetical protein